MQKCKNANMLIKNVLFQNLQICQLADLQIKFCTGTRIRTQIKGVGDPYASRCTMPAKNSSAPPQRRTGKSMIFKELFCIYQIYYKTQTSKKSKEALRYFQLIFAHNPCVFQCRQPDFRDNIHLFCLRK